MQVYKRSKRRTAWEAARVLFSTAVIFAIVWVMVKYIAPPLPQAAVPVLYGIPAVVFLTGLYTQIFLENIRLELHPDGKLCCYRAGRLWQTLNACKTSFFLKAEGTPFVAGILLIAAGEEAEKTLDISPLGLSQAKAACAELAACKKERSAEI